MTYLACRPNVTPVRAEIDGDDGAVVRRQHRCENVFLGRAVMSKGKPNIMSDARRRVGARERGAVSEE